MRLEIPFLRKNKTQEPPTSSSFLDLPKEAKNKSLGEKLELPDKDPIIDFVYRIPEVVSYIRINYPIPEHEGRELRPGHRLLFSIPEEFRGRIVRDVILRHRKNSKYSVDVGSDGYDPNGAYNRVELHETGIDRWTGWKDPKGYKTDKFAEPRSASNPEEEVLHDWIATVGPINTDAVRITNVGTNPDLSVSSVHGLEIVFYPEFKSIKFQEKIYCMGTEFIEPDKGKLMPSYGGGSFNEGRYEGAIALNQSGQALYELCSDSGPEAKIENGRLVIKFKPGRRFLQAEVAIGDTEHLSYINPKTRSNTRLGYAKLNMGVRRAKTGNVEWFVRNANVPPQGVITGGPDLGESLIEAGDELILESQADTSYVMGWRLAYKED